MAGRAVVRVLAVALALSWLGMEAPILHRHGDAGEGLYDDECPLARLAATETRVGIASAADPVQPIAAAPLSAAPAAARPAAVSVHPAVARAPPVSV
jgi:hypothetical protein